MIGLVAVHDGQDWTGFVTVIGILLALCAAAYVDAWRHDRRVHRFDPVTEDAIAEAVDLANEVDHEVDHTECVNPDCDLVLCYCADVDQPCLGAVEPGCAHNALVCDEHRLAECVDCRIGARDDAGIAW